jgi:membrane associated rhomboid family serine protease
MGNNLLNSTNIIILLNIIIFLIQQQIGTLSIFFGMNQLFITQDFWFQPLTSMFLHGSFLHLAMNMTALFQVGTMIEKHLGKIFFISVYILGGILTSIISLYIMYYFYNFSNMIGASGAICVLMGIFGFFNRYYLKGIIISILLISFAPLLLGINIAWYAHIVGFVLGIVISFLYKGIR